MVEMAGPSHSALAIVLGAIDYGDADRIVTLLTRDRGKLKGIARSAKKSRKRFAASLELFAKVEVRYRERAGAELAFLEESLLVDAHTALRASLDRIGAASYAAELVREAAWEKDVGAHLFDLLDAFLARLEKTDGACAGLVRAFELRALDVLGWRPELDACVTCGTTLLDDEAARFDPREGGVVCSRCGDARTGHALSAGTLRTMRAVLAGERIVFSRLALAESEAPVADLLTRQLGRELRSRAFLGGGE
jgi:DNA repair protein RecO (recombination protein O)